MTIDLDKIARELAQELSDHDADNDCYIFNATGRYSIEEFARRLVERIQREQEAETRVSNDYNADGKSCRIDDYLPSGTYLYTFPPATPSAVPDGMTLVRTDVVRFLVSRLLQEKRL